MKKQHPFSYYLSIALGVIATLCIAIIIIIWTRAIYSQSEEEKLRNTLQSVVSKNGASALFSMAGIPVNNIFYGDEGLSLFQGESGTWTYSADEQQNIAVFQKAKDSVVEIISKSDLSSTDTGTGVIISSDGYIVTNRHVLGDDASYTVVFSDSTSSTATLIGTDEITDIAVIKVNREKGDSLLVPIVFSSDKLTVGQKAIAIGNPYGYEFSLSVGVISGLNRLVATSSGAILPNMIQTDASINPGNSGGPLLNGHAEMVALNTSIYSTSGTSQGISFSIPANTVLSVATDLIRSGRVNRGWLDVLSVELSPQIAQYANLPVSEGIIVSQVVPSGFADKAGLKGGTQKTGYGKSIIYLGGDIIVKIGDKDVKTYQDYFTALFHTKAGDKIDITVYRDGKQVVISNVTLIEQTVENSRWIIK